MRQIPEIEQLSEELKDDYYIDYDVPPLLDYASLLAVKLEPLHEEHPEPKMLSYFVDNYFERLIHIKPDKLLKPERVNDITPVQGIEGMGFDLQKFWYLSLFIYDLACGYAGKNMEHKTKTPREAIEDLAIAIFSNIKITDIHGENDKVVDHSYSGNAELILKVNGKEHLITDNAKNLFYIGAAAFSEAENYQRGSTLDYGEGNTISKEFIENYLLKTEEESKSLLITYFYKLFKMFFTIYDEKLKAKKEVPKKVKGFSRKRLVSNMIYFTGLDPNYNFVEDDRYINGYTTKRYSGSNSKRNNANYYFIAKGLSPYLDKKGKKSTWKYSTFLRLHSGSSL